MLTSLIHVTTTTMRLQAKLFSPCLIFALTAMLVLLVIDDGGHTMVDACGRGFMQGGTGYDTVIIIEDVDNDKTQMSTAMTGKRPTKPTTEKSQKEPATTVPPL